MRKARFSEEQMVKILREVDKSPVAEVAKKHGISDQTICGGWRRYGTLAPADVKRLRQLEHENVQLKKLVADRDLEFDVMREVSRKNGERAGSPATAGLRAGARGVVATSVRAALGSPIDLGLRVAPGGEGCAGAWANIHVLTSSNVHHKGGCVNSRVTPL